MKCDACGLPMGDQGFWADHGDGCGPQYMWIRLCDLCADLLGLIPTAEEFAAEYASRLTVAR